MRKNRLSRNVDIDIWENEAIVLNEIIQWETGRVASMMMNSVGNSSLRNNYSSFHEKIMDLSTIPDEVSQQFGLSTGKQASWQNVVACYVFLLFSFVILSVALSCPNSRKQNDVPRLAPGKSVFATLSVFWFGDRPQLQISV